MRTETEKRQIKWFIGGLALIALLINSYFYKPDYFYQYFSPDYLYAHHITNW